MDILYTVYQKKKEIIVIKKYSIEICKDFTNLAFT